MRFIIDTSSLLAFVRYFQPFENNGRLTDFIQNNIKSGEFIILDKVAEESSYLSKKIIIQNLPFIKDRKIQTNTQSLLPYPKFFNMLENQFCNKVQKSKLKDEEYESRKSEFLDSADSKIILFLLENKRNLEIDGFTLVTEESNIENDGKVFKKLPSICEQLEIDHCNITTLFKIHYSINLSQYTK